MKNDKHFFADVSNYAGWLRTSHTARHLAIFELFKQTLELPGSVAEFGVWRGSSFFFLARLLDIFDVSKQETMGLSSRHLFGFDTFQGFVDIHDNDKNLSSHKEKKIGGLSFDIKTFETCLNHMKKELRYPENIHIIKGDVRDTWPKFIEQNSGVKFNFINMDMDLYEPTKKVLEHLPKVMVEEGMILFDEYGYPEWPGATQAVDEFIGKNNLTLKRISWAYGPSAFCVWKRN